MIANENEMTITLKRIDICDLLLACISADEISGGAKKWMKLHDNIKEQLTKADNEQ